MLSIKNPCISSSACCWFLLVILAVPQLAFSQGAYQPGQQVEYKANAYATTWQVGNVEYMTPSGQQVIVRSKPSEIYPKGDTRAYNLNEVRPFTGGADTNKSAATAQPQGKPAMPPQANVRDVPAQAAIQTPPATAQVPDKPATRPQVDAGRKPGTTGPVLSAQGVVDLLQATIGDPLRFADYRQKEAAMNEAARIIRERGVNFRFDKAPQAVTDALNKHGAYAQVTGAIRQNLGPPSTKEYYYGTWDMSQIGGETRVKQYRPGYDLVTRESGAKAGALVIKPDGTYIWNNASGTDKGSWRMATEAEMAQSDKGGAGIVLLNAKMGQRSKDWIVFKHSMTDGDNIAVADIDYRTRREYGGRM